MNGAPSQTPLVVTLLLGVVAWLVLSQRPPNPACLLLRVLSPHLVPMPHDVLLGLARERRPSQPPLLLALSPFAMGAGVRGDDGQKDDHPPSLPLIPMRNKDTAMNGAGPDMQKTTKETTKPRKIPQPNGRGALNSGGTLGNKGGTGRPPDAFKAFMREMASSQEAEQGIRDILMGGAGHPLFLAALKHVTEHGYGKPAPSHEITGGGEAIKGSKTYVIFAGQKIPV